MTKAALIVYADTQENEDLGRVVNAMEAVREFDEAGDEVKLIFDGAGTRWIPELSDEDHDYHDLYDQVDQHAEVCEYCANSYGVTDAADEAGVERVDEFDGHPSIRDLVVDGYEIITF